MKKFFCFMMILFVFGCMAYAGQAKLISQDETVTLNELKISGIIDNVALVNHAFPWEANSLVAVMKNGEVLLIDTPYTPAATKDLLQFIKKKLGKRKIIAVNTHFHIDRLGGNQALVENKIPIYASVLMKKMIIEKGKASLMQMIGMIDDPKIKNYYRNFKYVIPDHLFDEKQDKVLDFGEKVIIHYPGVAHSIDNLVVYLPEKRIIFGGCMILELTKQNAGNVVDGDLVEWSKSLQKIENKGYKIVIPGHGRAGGIELIEHTKTVVEKAIGKD